MQAEENQPQSTNCNASVPRQPGYFFLSDCPFDPADDPGAALRFRAEEQAKETPSYDDIHETVIMTAYELEQMAGAMFTEEEQAAVARAALQTSPAVTLREEAAAILKEGDPLRVLRDAFARLHIGDRVVLDAVVFGACVQRSLTATGIHPSLSGSRGAGKTSSVKAALHLMPPEDVLESSFSSKALLYDGNVTEGMIIFSDDTTLHTDLQELIKKAMSNFQHVTEHRTVEKVNGKMHTTVVTLPPRQMFIFTSVGDTGDDQLNDRQYKIGIEQNPASDSGFSAAVLRKAQDGTPEYPLTGEVLLCREILRQVRRHRYVVTVPFADRIVFQMISERRDMKMFLDFVQASAILHANQRQPAEMSPALCEDLKNRGINPRSVTVVAAGEADFAIARAAFHVIADTRSLNLTKFQRAVLTCILEHQSVGYGIAMPELVERLAGNGRRKQATYNNIWRALHGRNGVGGLLDKAPGLDWRQGKRQDGSGHLVNIYEAPEGLKETLFTVQEFVTLRSA